MTENTVDTQSDQSLRLAIAISLLRSKFQHKKKDPSPSQSDALRWKRKAKERKQELLRLREDLKEAQDASQCDLFPESASCKCYFFDKLGESSVNRLGSSSDRRFNDVLRRRFLRQVRFKERRRRAGSSTPQRPSICLGEDETEQLRASVDFLVELCDTISPTEETKFANLAHQAVDFILASLENLKSKEGNRELVEKIVNNLVTRMVRQMCSPLQAEGSNHAVTDAQFYVQHLLRKLGSEAYIGQRAMLSVAQRISMIQLIEFLVTDYLLEWSKADDFDNTLLEDWVTSILHARKALELLECRNSLFVLYMDRVTGELAKQVGQVPSLSKFMPDILNG